MSSRQKKDVFYIMSVVVDSFVIARCHKGLTYYDEGIMKYYTVNYKSETFQQGWQIIIT